jgi:hypothetical protein
VKVLKLAVLGGMVAAFGLQAAVVQRAVTAEPAGAQAALPAPVVLSTAEVPDAWSFDDRDRDRTRAVVVRAVALADPATRAAAVRRPPRPPRTAASGAMPAPGTPQAVLARAYVAAVAKSPRDCHLRTAHLAAIGQVESGSVGGRSVGVDHRVTPQIYGPLLDGGPFAVVHDSDGGSYDGDSSYDRAMGPLQFLPGTWRWAGRDGDGDGRRDPQNVFDAALATAGYLCSDGRDLRSGEQWRSAVLSYNFSGDYVAAVNDWVEFFTAHGLAAMDDVAFRVGSGGRASDLPVPDPSTSSSTTSATTSSTTAASTSATTTSRTPRPSGSTTTATPTASSTTRSAPPTRVPAPPPSSPTTTTPPPTSVTTPPADPSDPVVPSPSGTTAGAVPGAPGATG